ncbi:UbiD family decarboxylase [Pseudonocardia spinosispora]|uniref:UbiD family decarboxylase n=1 Tax=Pseudonocardia spinosispora TaxID=103441 RepID=UPI0003F65A95|nr:UbiD family decarboxylase [Pseudonocardia spinosispora]
MRDLREWLAVCDELGEIQHVTAEVGWEEEMSAISYLAGTREGGPALMFSQVTGHPGWRALWNPFGSSRRRIAVALGEDPELSMIELIAATKDKLEHAVEPKVVEDGPVFQNTLTGADIDLWQLPSAKFWPRDGGRYLGTADSVITRNPDGGNLNLGTYRMMVHGRDEIGLYLSPGKDALLHIEADWAAGLDVPICVVLGVDPLQFLVSSQGFPKNVSEYDYVGGLRGEPVEVVKARHSDLLIPARADVVLECVAEPGARRPEGPFGEFTGYYGKPGGAAPLLRVTAIHHRDDPIVTHALMADYPSCEQSLFFGVMRSARIWADLERMGIPGITGVYSHPAAAGGFGVVVLSLTQMYAGHAAQALALAAQCPGGAYYTKWIIAVESDVDPTDMNDVLWAMSTRCSPTHDIDILRNTWSTPLDPTLNPPELRRYGSKALINACREHRFLDTFSERTALREDVYRRVAQRWTELGFDGVAPEPRAFHAD